MISSRVNLYENTWDKISTYDRLHLQSFTVVLHAFNVPVQKPESKINQNVFFQCSFSECNLYNTFPWFLFAKTYLNQEIKNTIIH